MALTCAAAGFASSSGAAIGAASKSFAGVGIGAPNPGRYVLAIVTCAGGTFDGISSVSVDGVVWSFVDERLSTAAVKTSVSVWIGLKTGAATTATIDVAVLGGTMQACAVETFRITGYIGFFDIMKSTSDSPIAAPRALVTDDESFAFAAASGIKASATISATWSGITTEQVDADVNYISGHMGCQIAWQPTDGTPISPSVTYVAGMTSTSMAYIAFSLLGTKDATVTGTLAKATGAATVQQKENVTVAGTLGGLVGAASVQQKENVTVAATLGKAVGAASVQQSESVTVAATLNKATGAASLTQQENVTIAGTLGGLVGSASVQELEYATVAATLGALIGSGEVVLSEEVTVSGMLGGVAGAGEVEIELPSGTIAVDALLGGLTGAASIDLTLLAAVEGTLHSLVGAASMESTDEITIAGTLSGVAGEVHADGIISTSVAGTLSGLTGAGVLDPVLALAVAGTIGPLVGAASVTSTETLSVDATLGSMTASASVSLQNDFTIEGTLGAFVGEVVADIEEPSTTTEPPATTTEPSGDCYDVAADTRERILARLTEVLVATGATVARNDTTIPETVLPFIIVLDGDETVKEDTFGRGRPPYGPNIISLAPEVYITVGGDTPADVGADLSVWEEQIRGVVLTDATLIGLVHNQSIRYVGNEMAVMQGRQVYGQLKFEFIFDYVLRVEAPCEPISYVPDGTAPLRERILDALLDIAAQTEGVASVARNDASVPEDPEALPRVLVFDSDETSDSGAWYRGRPPSAPNFIRMEPEIYIVLREGSDPVGTTLNRIRYMLLRGLLTDATLAGLAADADVRYEGCQTALAAGRSLTGEMGMVVSINRVG